MEARQRMNFGALDLSLTSLGMARYNPAHVEATELRTGLRGHRRLSYLIECTAEYMLHMDLVAIEGPAFNSRTAFQHDGAGLWWLIAHELYRGGVPYVVIPPAMLKKYATGSGNAPKPDVMLAAAKRFPSIEFTSEDAADALWLLAMVCERYGVPLAAMPKDRTALLTANSSRKGHTHEPAIRWPPIGGHHAASTPSVAGR
jgi:Holliday junction resolvasome RuvABC endonuclease subunit